MQQTPIQAGTNVIGSQRFDAEPFRSEPLSSAARFERARITAADDPALSQIWNRLFGDANP